MGPLLARSVWPGGHAAVGEHAGENHRRTLYWSLQVGRHQVRRPLPPPPAAVRRPPPPPRTSHAPPRGSRRRARRPQNVYVMRDIACAGYVAGCNTRFFARNSEDTPAGNMLNAGNFGLSTARQNIMERLSFADDVGAMYGSMLAFPCWESQLQSGHLDTVLSVTTRLLPWEVQSAGGGTHNSFPGGQTAYTQYSQHLGLSSIHFGEDMKAAENMEFISQGSTNNATCFLGPHRRYDPFAKGFYSLEPGQGHFGPDAIPGVSCAHIRTISLYPYTTSTMLPIRRETYWPTVYETHPGWRYTEATSFLSMATRIIFFSQSVHANFFRHASV